MPHLYTSTPPILPCTVHIACHQCVKRFTASLSFVLMLLMSVARPSRWAEFLLPLQDLLKLFVLYHEETFNGFPYQSLNSCIMFACSTYVGRENPPHPLRRGYKAGESQCPRSNWTKHCSNQP